MYLDGHVQPVKSIGEFHDIWQVEYKACNVTLPSPFYAVKNFALLTM